MSNFFEPGEAPAFSIHNEAGAGPILIACDHASNRIPRSMNGLGIDPRLLGLHIAYDIGAQQVAMRLSENFDAPLLLANYSRLALDLNRFPEDPGMFLEVSDEHRIPGNELLDQASREVRVRHLFEPYHQKFGSMVSIIKQKYRQPIILSVHSFTNKFNGLERPWSFGVLWDHDENLAKNLLSNLEQQAQEQVPPMQIGDNKPYHANSPQGYSLVVHAKNTGVEMALVEIRQDLIGDAPGQQWASEILFESILPLLNFSPGCPA